MREGSRDTPDRGPKTTKPLPFWLKRKKHIEACVENVFPSLKTCSPTGVPKTFLSRPCLLRCEMLVLC